MSRLAFASALPMRNRNRCYVLSIITVYISSSPVCVYVCVWSHMVLMGIWTGDNMSKT